MLKYPRWKYWKYCAFQVKEKRFSFSILLPLKQNPSTQQPIWTRKTFPSAHVLGLRASRGVKEPSRAQWDETGSPCLRSYMEVHWMSIDFCSDLTLMDMVMTLTEASTWEPACFNVQEPFCSHEAQTFDQVRRIKARSYFTCIQLFLATRGQNTIKANCM